MKKLEIFITEENLSEVTEILQKHGVGGISLSDIKGRGRIHMKQFQKRQEST
jgi:nitrogen regulatory protein PII